MKHFSTIILLAGALVQLSARPPQDLNLRNDDYVYVDHIKTVRFHPGSLIVGFPAIELFSNAQLYFSFDDFQDEVHTYTYTLVHCNADWTPSNLAPTEYLNGFEEETIDTYEFSFNTTTPYTHFFMALPNNDMRPTKSGNYLLHVFDDEDERFPVITRRFVVVENIMQVAARLVRPSVVSKSNTHQEIDFQVAHPGIDVRNPRLEVSAFILQNGRWDNAVKNLKPLFVRGEELSFDYQDKVVFPAGKEFRPVDLRSFRYPSPEVANVESYPDGIDITLYKDDKRVLQPYFEYQDLDGRYFVETQDGSDPELQSDYASVLFTLYSPTEYDDADVFVFGAFTDWQLKPENQMVYNDRVNGYVADLFLKQGYYDYYYAVAPRDGGPPSIDDTEGNWYETENEYAILIYYRPFGERYDRLVAYHSFSSRQ